MMTTTTVVVVVTMTATTIIIVIVRTDLKRKVTIIIIIVVRSSRPNVRDRTATILYTITHGKRQTIKPYYIYVILTRLVLGNPRHESRETSSLAIRLKNYNFRRFQSIQWRCRHIYIYLLIWWIASRCMLYCFVGVRNFMSNLFFFPQFLNKIKCTVCVWWHVKTFRRVTLQRMSCMFHYIIYYIEIDLFRIHRTYIVRHVSLYFQRGTTVGIYYIVNTGTCTRPIHASSSIKTWNAPVKYNCCLHTCSKYVF